MENHEPRSDLALILQHVMSSWDEVENEYNRISRVAFSYASICPLAVNEACRQLQSTCTVAALADKEPVAQHFVNFVAGLLSLFKKRAVTLQLLK